MRKADLTDVSILGGVPYLIPPMMLTFLLQDAFIVKNRNV